MKKPEIAQRLARQAGVSRAEAADRLDRVVHDILQQLRHRREAALPGFGRFIVAPDGRLGFQRKRD